MPTRKIYTLSIIAALLALVLRWWLIFVWGHISYDIVGFVIPWVQFMADNGHFHAMREYFSDYSAPYLYFLGLLSYFPEHTAIAVKVMSAVFDVLCAVAVAEVAYCVRPVKWVRPLAFAAALWVPTCWLNSSVWGQCDVIYSTFALWGLACMMRRKPVQAMIWTGVAIAFKLQAVFILPFYFFMLLKGRLRWWHVGMALLAYVAMLVPSFFMGRPVASIWEVYMSQTGTYNTLCSSFPNIYVWAMKLKLVSDGWVTVALVAPALALIFGTLWWLARGRKGYRGEIDSRLMLAVAFIVLAAVPMVLPRMHDRYMFMGDMLAVAFVAAWPRRWYLGVAIDLVSFLTYMPFLFGHIISHRWIFVAAVIYGVDLVALVYWFAATYLPQVHLPWMRRERQ